MSWEDEDNDWQPPAAGDDAGLNDKWDGEDEDDVADDWDAPEEKKEVKPAGPVVKKALSKRQLAKKKEEEERLAALKKAEARSKSRNPEDEAEMRAAQKKAIEESNASLCDDLFGGDGFEAPAGGEFKNEQLETDNVDMIVKTDEILALKNLKIAPQEALDDVVLKNADDYKKFAIKVSGLATKAGNQKLVVQFANALLAECTKKMKLDDCNNIKKSITVICSQKQKDEAGKKKKGGAKKAQLAMSRPNNGFDDGADDYDDGMDDFF